MITKGQLKNHFFGVAKKLGAAARSEITQKLLIASLDVLAAGEMSPKVRAGLSVIRAFSNAHGKKYADKREAALTKGMQHAGHSASAHIM